MSIPVTAVSLLSADDGPAFDVINPAGRGDFVFICEHASNSIPRSLRGLGLSEDAQASHIAWDPGARDVARKLAERFDAPLLASRVSRLVYDCNRPPEAPDAIALSSENRVVPGNQGLTPEQVSARVEEVYVPFRNAVHDAIAARLAQGQRPALVTIHSFTPVYLGEARRVELGILHDTDTRLADALLHRAHAVTGLQAERNQPYGPDDGVTHTLQQHALPNGLLNVMIEVRNDLIADEASITRLAGVLGELLRDALASIGGR